MNTKGYKIFLKSHEYFCSFSNSPEFNIISYLLELLSKNSNAASKRFWTHCVSSLQIVLLSPFSLRNCLNLSLTLLVYVDLQDKWSVSNHDEEFLEAKKIEQSFTEPWWFLHTFAEFGRKFIGMYKFRWKLFYKVDDTKNH